MLRPLLLLSAAAMLMTGTAMAQTAPAPGATTDTMSQTAPGTAPPLMTAPRPDDQPTTGPVASPPGVSGEAPSREMQNPAAPVAGSPPVAALPSAALNPDQARSMVGTELRTRDGQPGGRILDFTLSQPGDLIDRIVVAPNDVLGLGDKLVVVPAGALTNGPDGPMLDMEQADIGKAPAFAYGDVPTVTRPDSQ